MEYPTLTPSLYLSTLINPHQPSSTLSTPSTLTINNSILKLDLTYRQIWNISAPIMLGSAAQNVIALSDAVLLYHLGEVEFAAIGFVGVFYITIAAIGYSFSRGGQIIIARLMGEGRPGAVGHVFHTMLLFELALAAMMWAFMRFGTGWFFSLFLDNSPDVYSKCLEYIHYRSYGIFFSYSGVALISLYTGIARPGIILLDTIVLAIVNLALNYGLIFGKFGLPAMGIGGSGLASSIAEGVAFVVFVLFMALDRKNRVLQIFSMPRPDWPLTRQQLNIALPVVAHAAVGQGSWIFFFGMVENLGERALAISNLARTVYLMLSIPLWGFSSGVNTLVSNLIGQERHSDGVQAFDKHAGLVNLLIDRRTHARHDPHVGDNVRTVGKFDAVLGDGRTDRAHAERDDIQRAALHATAEQPVQLRFHRRGRFPIVRGAGVFG